MIRKGSDVAIIACGEMVHPAVKAADILEKEGISTTVLDMYCIKPLDIEAIINATENAKVVVTGRNILSLAVLVPWWHRSCLQTVRKK